MQRDVSDADDEDLITLIRAITVESDRLSDVFAGAHGLHRTDLDALVHILDAARDGDPVSPGQLAARLGLSAPATTALLARLERDGHVTRRPDPHDRRRVVLEMHEQALALAGQFFGPLGRAVRAVVAEFDEGERETVRRFLTGVRRATIEVRERHARGD